MTEYEDRVEATGSVPVEYEPSDLVKWLKQQAHKASAVEGIQKDWLCTAALVMAVERLTMSLDRTNQLLARLEEQHPPS